MSYVPLNVRTEYSFGAAMCRVEELVERARGLHLGAVGVADLHATWAFPELAQAAQRAGIRALYGARVHVVPYLPSDQLPPYEVTLLAMDATGYRNLVRLLHHANLERTGVSLADLEMAADGLLALDAAATGGIGTCLANGDPELALRRAAALKAVFGSDRMFVEIQRQTPAASGLEAHVLRIARRLNLGIVATADVRYLEAHEHAAFRVLEQLDTSDESHTATSAPHPAATHLPSPLEMQRRFADLPEALATTLLIAERCNLDFTSVASATATDACADSSEDLRQLCERKTCARYRTQCYQDVPVTVRDRIADELAWIDERRLASCFLVAHDVVHLAKKEGVPVGPGRGAVAGSLVAHVLGICAVDPLQHDLRFDCFIPPPGECLDAPLVLEVGDGDEAAWLQHLRGVRPGVRVERLAALQRRSGVDLLRGVARVLGVDSAVVVGLERHLRTSRAATLLDAVERVPAIGRSYRSHEATRQLIEVCSRLEGLPYHASLRAGGLLTLPALSEPTFAAERWAGCLVTQLTERNAEALGWLPLLLRPCPPEFCSAESPGQQHAIAWNDAATFHQMLQDDGVRPGPLADAAGRALLTRIQPRALADWADAVALRLRWEQDAAWVERFLEERLDAGRAASAARALSAANRCATRPPILYREQIVEAAMQLGGFSYPAASALRRSIEAGDVVQLGRWRRLFVSGALEAGVDVGAADALFEQLAGARHAVSRAHCVALAVGAYEACYRQVHDPAKTRATDRMPAKRAAAAGEASVWWSRRQVPPSPQRLPVQLALAFDAVGGEAPAAAPGGASQPARRLWLAGRVVRRQAVRVEKIRKAG